jgi:NAD(P)-dependent dehydrogenase (short-subunit alcohol dehydrogenase family)
LKEWWKGFETNVLGTVLVTHTYLRTKAAEQEGVVITLNTIGAHWGKISKLSAYVASKAASLHMIEIFQSEKPKVRFVSVHPGSIATAMGEKPGLSGAFPSRDPILAANFILWSASSEAQFLNGRFVWVNWDVDELKAKNEDILDEGLWQYIYRRTRLEHGKSYCTASEGFLFAITKVSS